MTNATITKPTPLQKALKSFGVKAKVGTGVGTNGFLADVASHRGQVNMFLGGSKVTVFGDKKQKQAVLHIDDEERDEGLELHLEYRTILTQFFAPRRFPSNQTAAIELTNSALGANHGLVLGLIGQAEYRLPTVSSARITGYEVEFISSEKQQLNFYQKAELNPKYRGRIKAIVRRAVGSGGGECLLVGQDEDHHFISALPKRVYTVKQAHAVLKPKGLRKGWRRQGEWFFSPCSKKEIKTIEEHLESNIYQEKGEQDFLPRIRDWSDSDHVTVNKVVIDGKAFVIGYIVHDREAGQHKPFYLNKWHQVIRNNEVVSENETWD